MEKSNRKIKVVMIGELGVGKTSLLKSFVKGDFLHNYTPTVGANVVKKQFELYDRNNSLCELNLNIWDISGQEKWLKIRSTYLNRAHGIFIVADLTRMDSFERIESQWYPDVKKFAEIGTPIILVCNKVDLKQKVSDSYIEEFVSRLHFDSVVRTSAKTNQNVNYTFFLLINRSAILEQPVIVKSH